MSTKKQLLGSVVRVVLYQMLWILLVVYGLRIHSHLFSLSPFFSIFPILAWFWNETIYCFILIYWNCCHLRPNMTKCLTVLFIFCLRWNILQHNLLKLWQARRKLNDLYMKCYYFYTLSNTEQMTHDTVGNCDHVMISGDYFCIM